MTRRLILLGSLAALILNVPVFSAHDDYRIIGTVAKVDPASIDVKQTKDGKTIGMDITKETVVTRDKKKVPVAELKAGLNVVVDARGDSLEELEVVSIRIVPPPAKR
jgi:hypothetical protein